MKTIFSKILIIVLFLSITSNIFAQNSDDALRFSQLYNGGTARYLSMGGAFSALGGDNSVLSTNPAGVAIYKSSELTFSPGINFSKSNADFLKTSKSNNKTNFNVSNIGYVWSIVSGDEYEWKGFNFAMGYNRLNNFHRNFTIEGQNHQTSITDQWLRDANDNNWSDYGNQLAYGIQDNNKNQGLILYDQVSYTNTATGQTGVDSWYLSDFDERLDLLNTNNPKYDGNYSPKYGELQHKEVEEKGHTGEYYFAMGANFSDKLYFGATIGVQHIHYEKMSEYTEIDKDNVIDGFKSLTYNQYLESSGVGVNLKLGAIFRPNDFVRMGFAFHTPTVYSMKDSWSSDLSATFDKSNDYYEKSPEGTFNYTYTSPLRAIASIGFVIEKIALISAEYEFVDYPSARFSSIDDNFFDVKKDIKNRFQSTGNVKLGAELALDNFRIRGGYALYGSPYKSEEVNKDASRKDLSFGVGIKEEDYFFDIAFVNSTLNEKYFMYNYQNLKSADLNNKSNYIVATLGFKF